MAHEDLDQNTRRTNSLADRCRPGYRASDRVGIGTARSQVIAIDAKRPEETANKIGPTAYAFQFAVTREEDWRSVATQCRDVGEVDIVVNNAGHFPNRSIDALDLATWGKIMARIYSHFSSAKYFLPNMRKKSGVASSEFRRIWLDSPEPE